MKNNKANQSFDNHVTSFCIAGLAALSILLIVERANSCPVETKDDLQRAKFYACLVQPGCKLTDIKVEKKAKHSDRKNHLIPPVSKDAIKP